MGEHYPVAHSEPKSFAVSERDIVCFANRFGNTFSVTVGDVRISCCEPCADGLGWFDARAGEFTQSISKSS